MQVDCCVLEDNARAGVPADYQRDIADSGGATQGSAVLQNSQPDDWQQLQSARPALAS